MKFAAYLLLGAFALAAAAPHPENAVVPEETFVQDADSSCDDVFGALDEDTGVPADLYTLADNLLEEGKDMLKEKLPELLKCHKQKSLLRKACKTAEKGLSEAIDALGAKSLIDQVVAALKPKAEEFFEDHNGAEIAEVADTFVKAKGMNRKKAKKFISEELSHVLGLLLNELQPPLMKLIPAFFFKLVPGWSLVPKKLKKMIIAKVYDATTQGDAYAKLTEKFQELMHKLAVHVVKITTIDQAVTKVVMDTPVPCAFQLAMKLASSVSC